MTSSVESFPTLGFLAADWIEHHCSVPSGFELGRSLVHDGWQLTCTVNHYRVREGIEFTPDKPLLNTAFTYRRSVVVGPQKAGKSPWGASIIIFEAVGPCLFAGWAKGGEVYRCADDVCGCDFEYVYESGEPMGMVRNKSLIQMLATAENQTANVYEPIQTMLHSNKNLENLLRVREGFVRLPNNGKIQPVSASAKSKLGNPINFALGDESGLYTETGTKLLGVWQTMRRGLAGMGGRSIEITNPWDPMENSSAQLAFESRVKDIYRYYQKPPADLSYANKRERHKIHTIVYADAPWVNVESIDAEAAELVETDPTQAERFYGNRLVQGLGAFITDQVWSEGDALVPVDEKRISLGFDGSTSGDWTAIRAETIDGVLFTPTYGPDKRQTIWNPAEWGGRVPRSEVRAAVAELFANFEVSRMYCDPRDWQTEIDEWAAQYGEDHVVQWPTNSIQRMFDGLNRFLTDLEEGSLKHDDCRIAQTHALNARKLAKPGDKYILGKPSEHQKIDVLMASVLAHEGAADARADGWADLLDPRMFCWT